MLEHHQSSLLKWEPEWSFADTLGPKDTDTPMIFAYSFVYRQNSPEGAGSFRLQFCIWFFHYDDQVLQIRSPNALY